MPQKDPKHNIDALLIGTGEFSFAEGAISAADARAKGYLDFGNIAAFTPSRESTLEEHFGSYRGVRRKDAIVVTETDLSYELTVDEFHTKNVALLYGGTIGAEWVQAAQAAVAIDPLVFTAPLPSGTVKWYDITVTSGVRLRQLTSVTITGKVEGTDFEVDLLLGRVRFLINQTTTLNGTVTAPALATGTNGAMQTIVPLNNILLNGFGRLVIFDQNNKGKVVLDHTDFSCQLTAEASGEQDGTGFGEITITVTITSEAGTVYLRNPNQN